MKAICGSIHFDGAPGNPRNAAAMRTALLGRGEAQEQAFCAGATALAGVTWSPAADTIRVHALNDPTLYTHPESGCTIAADALLFEREALCAALDLPPSAHSTLDDAELILRAYLRWGENCAARLDGDFAFVVSDARQQRVYAARDGMGVRPLYFHHVPGALFAFASNARAVVASPRVPAEANAHRIADFLLDDEDINTVSTFYRAVRRLPPAHWCSVDARDYREACYWSPGDRPPAALPSGDDAWTEAVREALERAVRQHVAGTRRTGGAIGSMISGGLDSSAIAAIASDLMATNGWGPLPVFSAIDSADAQCAETRAIRAMLARPGFAPSLADAAQLDALLPDLVQSMDAAEEPFDHAMTLPHTQYLLASRAGVGAVFDGIDADSMFSDGGHMQRLLRSGRWITAWRESAGMAPFFYDGRWPAWKQLAAVVPGAFVPDILKRSVRGVRQRRDHRAVMHASLIAEDFAKRMGRDAPAQRPVASARVQPSKLLQERHDTIRSTALTAGIERYRRVASIHGIEPRHPFLDRRLVELCLHLPDRQRACDGWTKCVLRHAVSSRLPAEVCWRRGKEHLGFGYSQALFDRDRNARLDDLWSNRSWLEPYVDMDRLARHIARYRRDGSAEDAVLLLGARALLGWMKRLPSTASIQDEANAEAGPDR